MKTLIFLPGTICDSRLFAAQIAYFEAAGWQVQVPKITGHSGGLQGLAGDLLQALPSRFAAVGLSLGGIVALEMLRQDASRITHLALLDTNDGADTEIGRAKREADYRRAGEVGIAEFFAAEMFPRYVHSANRNDAAMRRTVVEMATAGGADLWRAQMDLLCTREDARGLLAAAGETRLLVGCGEEDAICPPELHRAMAAAAGVELHLFAGAGHLSSLEAPGQVTDVLVGLLTPP